MRSTHLFCILMVLFLGGAHAEVVDPSTASLLKGSSSPEPEDLDSDRFVKPKAKPTAPVIKRHPKSIAPPQEAPAVAPEPEAKAPAPAATPPANPSLSNQMRKLVLGGTDEEIDAYLNQIHPLDRRHNRVEIGLGPSFYDNSSTSTNSARRFSSAGPGVSAEAKVWITPFFGIRAGYFTSLDGTVPSQGLKQSVSTDYQNVEFGFRFRKHFGVTRRAPSLTWGLDLVQNSFKVPTDTPDRVSTTTSGLSLSLETDLPSGRHYANIFGLELRPRMVHAETSNSQLKSGGSNSTDAIGAWAGGEFILDRGSQIFWRLRDSLEKNAFEGLGHGVDPQTGQTPNGSSVTNNMLIFSVGYKWGS